MSDRKFLAPADYIARGILIGGAVGAIGGMFGFTRGIFWGVGLGMCAGFLAGLTLARRASKKRG